MTEERKDQYKSLLIMFAGFALIGFRFHYWYLVVAAIAILICGLVSTYLLVMITSGWIWVGEKIGAVMSRVVLSIVFICILTPVSVLYRAFGGKTIKEKKESYFIDRNHTYTGADMEKIF